MVTDGRMSGASGKVPAAIHMHPEAVLGGLIAKIKTGDKIKVDPLNGSVEVLETGVEGRTAAQQPPSKTATGLGMNMFGTMRLATSDAESGAGFLGTVAS